MFGNKCPTTSQPTCLNGQMVNKMLLHENSIESLSRQPFPYSFAQHSNPYAADTPYSTTTQTFGIIILLLNLKWFKSLTLNPCTVSGTLASLTIPTHREIHALKKTPTANYHEHALFTINPMSRALLIPDPYKHLHIQPPYISKTLTPPLHPLRPFDYPKLCSVMTPA